MGKLTKSERKIYNEGKRAGYNEGYNQGLHDGNPFNKMFDYINNVLKTINEMEPEERARLLAAYNKKSEGEE